ncbi:uncharacterized protein LOC106178945 [Lingula anatina]|uniref:Uncharacterized protein LOC106178945 n=1 Tax=Lingula anatina TaxID=7574 RepID=A0A1S3K5U6_LINAN|nr:uncharacterized protein LOC106178945 [Lingula anatina]|eukprot:XP_013417804.1 uncharacterized protein LOC106178945 [Lingula anatina]
MASAKAPSRRYKSRDFCGLYSVFTISAGLVFPLALAFSSSRHITAVCLEVFQGYLYLVSIGYLIYVFLHYLHVKDPEKPRQVAYHENKVHLDHADKDEDGFSNGATSSKESPKKSVASGEEELPAVHYGGEGLTLYLRIGAIIFGFGGFLYDILKIIEFGTEVSRGCKPSTNIVSTVINPIFVIVQTYFIFRFHKIVVTKKKGLANFGFSHVAATNACVFVAYSILDTEDDFRESLKETADNSTPNECSRLQSLFDRASPFLYPCVLEYSIIGAALMYTIYKSIGEPPEDEFERQERERDKQLKSRALKDHVPSVIGGILGLGVGLVTVIMITIYMVVFEDSDTGNDVIGVDIIASLDILLLALAGISVIIGFVWMKDLKYMGMEIDTLDDNLLLVSTAGVFVNGLFLLLSVVSSIGEAETSTVIPILFLCVMGMTQATAQFVFITDSSRRVPDVKTPYSTHAAHRRGRGLIVFLMACNLCIWAVNTLAVKRVEKITIFNDFYGTLPWMILYNLTVPVVIFFRFHSAAVLAISWKNAFVKKD